MTYRETLSEISELCRGEATAFAAFDLRELPVELDGMLGDVAEYFAGSVPALGIYGEAFGPRDLCRFYGTEEMGLYNRDAVPSYCVVPYGFVTFATDLSGDAYVVDLYEGDVYLLFHDDDWENLIEQHLDEVNGARLAVMQNASHQAASLAEFLDDVLSRLREIAEAERDFAIRGQEDPHAENDSGDTYLILAARENDLNAVQFSVQQGADIAFVGSNNRDALGEACVYGYIEIARYLLEQGASPDVRFNYGETPLMLAVRYHHPEIVRALLNAGADKTLKDEQNRTAIDHISPLRDTSELRKLLS